MKKTIILFSFITIFCLSTFMFGAYIITTPAQGDKWEKTGIHAIKWIKLGDKTEKVNLYLYDKTGKNKIMTIVEGVKNTGEYYCNFNIFNKVPEGEYKVFIISQKGTFMRSMPESNLILNSIEDLDFAVTYAFLKKDADDLEEKTFSFMSALYPQSQR